MTAVGETLDRPNDIWPMLLSAGELITTAEMPVVMSVCRQRLDGLQACGDAGLLQPLPSALPELMDVCSPSRNHDDGAFQPRGSHGGGPRSQARRVRRTHHR